jgi:putative ABC transport system permease protein
MSALVLALAHLRHHWGRSVVLLLAVAAILAVPFASRALMGAAQDRLTARAEATPLVLGRPGSRLDLVMSAVYFAEDQPQPLAMTDVEAIWEGGLALPVPLHTAFTAEGARVVGTTLDYFELRGLEVAEGRALAVLGDAVLGAAAAGRLGLAPGATVVSDPESLFDLDGAYPLEMPVVGVLAPTGTPDDEAVFVDVKTAWVIAGIGHGHDDVAAASASASAAGTAPAGASSDTAALAGVVEYNRITPQNLESFHFHGDPGAHPVSSVIVAPFDARSATILKGRYLDPDGRAQLVEPAAVVGGLVDRLLRIRAVLDAVAAVVGAAALLAVALAVFLSYRLREDEVRTAFRIGAPRGAIAALLGAETVILLSGAAAMAAGATWIVGARAEAWVAWLVGL